MLRVRVLNVLHCWITAERFERRCPLRLDFLTAAYRNAPGEVHLRGTGQCQDSVHFSRERTKRHVKRCRMLRLHLIEDSLQFPVSPSESGHLT